MTMYYVDLPDEDVRDKPQTAGAVNVISAGRITKQTKICPRGDTAWQPAYVYPDWWEQKAPASPGVASGGVPSANLQAEADKTSDPDTSPPAYKPKELQWVLQLLATISILAGIVLVLGREFTIGFSGILSGIFLVWMSSVIDLLNKIHYRLKYWNRLDK